MYIREATAEDLDEILKLFDETIRNVNSKDYSSQQIQVWSSAKNRNIWTEKIKDQSFLIAISNEKIVGFSSIDSVGFLDFMYVHYQHLRKGIATALLNKIEAIAVAQSNKSIWSSVSITAQPFFIKKGYLHFDSVLKEVDGVSFTNALMKKVL
ncbi:GNAT family N-acetyltransferase [Ekhidna sp.]